MLIRAIFAALLIFVVVRLIPVIYNLGWALAGLAALLLVGVCLIVAIVEHAKEAAGCLGLIALVATYALFVAHPVLAIVGLIGLGVAAQMIAKNWKERQARALPEEPIASELPPLPPPNPEAETE
jgi:hypothetical protein